MMDTEPTNLEEVAWAAARIDGMLSGKCDSSQETVGMFLGAGLGATKEGKMAPSFL